MLSGSEEQAEQALIDYALQRGYLQPAQIAQARAEVAQARSRGQALGILGVLAQRLPAHLHPELSAVYQRSSSGRLLQQMGPQSGVVTLGGAGAPTVSGASGRTPGQAAGGAAPGANAHEVVRGLQEICQRIPDFAPHANLVLERLAELGRGGMGAVYRVRDSRLGREAALKVILGEADEASRIRFRREAEITARLDHPAIPPVYEAGTTVAGEAYMLMRVIEGETLSLRIQDLQLGGLDRAGTRDLLQVLVKAGEAVGYAHGQGVIHRDLKPDNVMVGAFGEVLVMDWGLAREEGKEEVAAVLELGRTKLDADEAQAAGLTQVGSVMGTPGYMAPEQADGLPADARSDVYALGAILVEALTGRPPVTGKGVLQVVLATAEGKIELPRDRRPETPAELNSIAKKALALEARHRYASAEEFVADLQAYLAGQPVNAHDYRLAEQIRALPGRHPGLTGLLLIALLATLVAVLAFAYRASEAARREAVISARQAEEARREAEESRTAAERAKAAALRSAKQAETARADAVDAERAGRSYSDDAKLRRLLDEQPLLSGRQGPLKAWIKRAEVVLSRLAGHQARAREVAAPSEGELEAAREIERDVLDHLLRHSKIVETALIVERRRLEQTREIEAYHHRAQTQRAWREAAEAIAATPRYRGLKLKPILGLYPKGPDPTSGLWEFWHMESGPDPLRSTAGHLQVSNESGIVLVLIPGGEFRMGHERDGDSRPVHEVRIEPFFLSKYEVTQRQWGRMTNRQPSEYGAGLTISGTKFKITHAHPVERVTREEAQHGAMRGNLRLPSEAEWEYAARAGTTTPWHTGATPASLAGAVNLADQTFRRGGGKVWVEVDDGQLLHAPVGSYPPNAWGLHDMLGNVCEWVQDVYLYGYREALSTGEPWKRYADGTAPSFVFRGGSFASIAVQVRSDYRAAQSISFRSSELGLRLARSLQADPSGF